MPPMRPQGTARGQRTAPAARSALALLGLRQPRARLHQDVAHRRLVRGADRVVSAWQRPAELAAPLFEYSTVTPTLVSTSRDWNARRSKSSHLSFGSHSMFKLSLAASAVVAATLATPSQATGAFRDREDPAVVREWNVLAEGTIPAAAGPSLPRSYAMMHIAMFDAVNSIEGGYTAYRVRVPATRFASSEAAAAQAAHDVLVSLYPANAAKFDTALGTRLATIQPLRAQLGAQVGREVAKKILEWRANDGWSTPQTYTPPAIAGIWQPTPPNFPA